MLTSASDRCGSGNRSARALPGARVERRLRKRAIASQSPQGTDWTCLRDRSGSGLASMLSKRTRSMGFPRVACQETQRNARDAAGSGPRQLGDHFGGARAATCRRGNGWVPLLPGQRERDASRNQLHPRGRHGPRLRWLECESRSQQVSSLETRSSARGRAARLVCASGGSRTPRGHHRGGSPHPERDGIRDPPHEGRGFRLSRIGTISHSSDLFVRSLLIGHGRFAS